MRGFGRTGWQVSEVGYGMWGVGAGEGGWQGADDRESMESLWEAVSQGCNFFDTAWIYGRGHSEVLLGRLLKEFSGKKLYVASKIPPKDRAWPSKRTSRLEDVFPASHILEYTEKSLVNLRIDSIDLMQFHVWEDSWADDKRWQDAILTLKQRNWIKAIGISINRWEPRNVLRTLATGLIDSVQVCYNIFDQSPEDELFPTCVKSGVAVIARVPFDEGSLTGTLTPDSSWPPGDWRGSYFVPENLVPSLERVERLKKLAQNGMTLPAMALGFILANPAISTVIPGMRKVRHVRENLRAGKNTPLAPELVMELKKHRWDREPTWWSQ